MWNLKQPRLEYAIQANCPYLKRDMNHLERIQWAAAWCVEGLGVPHLWRTAQSPKPQPLEKRMLKNGPDPQDIDLETTKFFKIRLLHQTGITRRRRNRFALRVVSYWNHWPLAVQWVPEPRAFRKLILDSNIYPEFLLIYSTCTPIWSFG